MTKAQEAGIEIGKRLEGANEWDNNTQILWEDWGHDSTFGEVGDKHRWYTNMTTYFIFDDKSVLALDWNEGNTEEQDNEGPTRVYLVEPYEVTTVKYREMPSKKFRTDV